MTIYLYVKTHNKTGLKYLGKTTNQDPHAYHGSGADWKTHLKEHGIDYTTEIIRECQTNKEITKLMKIDYATINKLRSGLHRIFELFPEFKEHLIV